MEDENYTIDKIKKAFKISIKEQSRHEIVRDKIVNGYYLQYETSISKVNKDEWNKLLGNNGSYDWEGVKSLEESFSGNERIEENWDFHYFIIRDKKSNPLLATFFTTALYKDDMLTPESISMQVEEKRKKDFYYLTSKTLAMGSLLTEGKHLYLDRSYSNWQQVLTILMEEISKLQEKENASLLLLRDFDSEDWEMKDFLYAEGFVKIDMPNTNIVENKSWTTKDEFLQNLSARNRRHVRKDVFDFEHYFDVEVKHELSDEEVDYFYKLYCNVKDRNLGFNEFAYPKKVIKTMSRFSNWEFIVLRLKPEYDKRPVNLPVGVVFAHKHATHYSPMLVGMDYDFVYQYNVYRQCIFQVVKRANDLGIRKIHLGLSADTEKRKCGAFQIKTVAYLQAKDNFNFELLESMASLDVKKAS